MSLMLARTLGASVSRVLTQNCSILVGSDPSVVSIKNIPTPTTKNMREYRFSLTRILPYKGRFYDSALIRENTGQ